MSISNLFQPNDFDLKCKSITFAGGSAFQKYVEAGYGNTLTGPFAAPVPTSGGLYRQLDRVYSLSLGQTTGTSTVAAPITLGTPLPTTNMWADLNFPIWVIDNGVTVPGTFRIAFGTGIATIYVGFNGNFSNVGTCGFPGFSVTYGSFNV